MICCTGPKGWAPMRQIKNNFKINLFKTQTVIGMISTTFKNQDCEPQNRLFNRKYVQEAFHQLYCFLFILICKPN